MSCNKNKFTQLHVPSPSPSQYQLSSLSKFKRLRIVRKGNGEIIGKNNNTLTLSTINIRKGFTDKYKQIKNEIKQSNVDIILLQEIGLTRNASKLISKIFPAYDVYTNLVRIKFKPRSLLGGKFKRKSAKRGVAILISKELGKEFNIEKIYKDNDVRAIILHCTNEKQNFLLGNVYAPAEGFSKNKDWIKVLKMKCSHWANKLKADIVLGGDWNIKLNETPSYFDDFINKLQLDDLTRTQEDEAKATFTKWKKDSKITRRLDGWFGTRRIKELCKGYEVNKNSDINTDHRPVLIKLQWQRLNTSDSPDDPILIENKILKLAAKNMSKEEWENYKLVTDAQFEQKKENWKNAIEQARINKDINNITEVIREGIKYMKGNIMLSNTEKQAQIKINKKERNYEKLITTKKIARYQKHKQRLLRIRNVIKKFRLSANISKRGSKLITSLSKKQGYSKFKLDNITTNNRQKNKKLEKWVTKSIKRVNSKESTKKRIWVQKKIQQTRSNNLKLYNEDTKFFMMKYMKKMTKNGKIHKIPEAAMHKYSLNQIPPNEQVNEYVVKYFTDLFKSQEKASEASRKWDKHYTKVNEGKGNEKTITEIKESEITQTVKKLRLGKAGGIDGVVNEMIKNGGNEMLSWLKEIFNTCLLIEDIPDVWKQSLMRMLKKDAKADQNNVSNYRGITLLPVMYKIFSTILTKRLYKYVEKNQLIGDLQFGFRKNKSTKAAIRILTNIYEDAKSWDKELWVVFLDIQKAYDTVEFWALKEILGKFHFDPKIINIIINMNKNLKCKVIFENKSSSNFNIYRGLRQGCPLSPLLFIIFLEPLLKWIQNCDKGYTMKGKNSQVSIPYTAFADDIVLYNSNKEIMNKYIHKCVEYLECYSMNFNYDKSIATGNKGNKGKPVMRDTTTKQLKEMKWLTSSESFKYLGLDVNLDLDWKENIKRVNSKVYYKIKRLKCLRVDTRLKAKILNAVIIPTIAYTLPFINGVNQIMEWDKLLKKCIKNIARIKITSSTAMLQSSTKKGGLNLKSIKYLQREIIIEEFFNIINFENKQETLYKTTIIRLEDTLNKFRVSNIAELNKIEFWDCNTFIERTMKLIKELDILCVDKKREEVNLNHILGNVEIDNGNLGLLAKFKRYNITGLKQITKDGKLRPREELNKLFDKQSILSIRLCKHYFVAMTTT